MPTAVGYTWVTVAGALLFFLGCLETVEAQIVAALGGVYERGARSKNLASFVEVPAISVSRHVGAKAIAFLKNPSAPRISVSFNEHHDIRLITAFRENRCDGAVHDENVRELKVVRFEYQYGCALVAHPRCELRALGIECATYALKTKFFRIALNVRVQNNARVLLETQV